MNHDQWRRLCWLALSLQATEPSLMPFEFRPRTSIAENLLNPPLCKIFDFFLPIVFFLSICLVCLPTSISAYLDPSHLHKLCYVDPLLSCISTQIPNLHEHVELLIFKITSFM